MSFRKLPEWLNDDAIAPPPGVGASLALVSLVQRAGMWLRMRQPRTRVNARVISFGNITAGGTGKTPAVMERAQREVQSGHRVAVITRGYGSERVHEPCVIAPGEVFQDLDRKIGDEPALIRRRVPGAWIVKSADRVAGALAAIAQGCDCLLLDDGFQSVALERDENIVLLDASRPFGNGCLIPRGVLREPAPALQRATEVWLTRCDRAPNLDRSIAEVSRCHGKPPTRLTCHAPTGLWRVCDGAESSLSLLQGARVALASAIAQPAEFQRTVQELGAEITGCQFYRDHERFKAEVLPQEGMLIVTEKDAVRLPCAGENVYALAVDLVDYTP